MSKKNEAENHFKYYELEIGQSRLNYEDGHIIIKADSLNDAIARYNDNTGHVLLRGEIISGRRVYFVYDNFELRTKSEA